MDDGAELSVSVFTAEPRDAGVRLDVVISEREEITRSAAAKLIDGGAVLLNGAKPLKNAKLKIGDEIRVEYPPTVPSVAEPENIPLDIVYEDDDIIVVNKPQGMVVHPAAGNYTGTLVNALLYHCKNSLSGIGGVVRPGIVHRIDKDTSGLLVAAKNDAAHLCLCEQLKTHSLCRIYYAVALGNFKTDGGTVDAPVGRHPTDRKKMAVFPKDDQRAKQAVTHYTVLERFDGFSYLKCRLETGRTHQIRVHMASIGHPLLGDEVYGGTKNRFYMCNKDIIKGQCLHAGELRLVHPVTGEEMTFSCPVPDNMKKVTEKLRKLS